MDDISSISALPLYFFVLTWGLPKKGVKSFQLRLIKMLKKNQEAVYELTLY